MEKNLITPVRPTPAGAHPPAQWDRVPTSDDRASDIRLQTAPHHFTTDGFQHEYDMHTLRTHTRRTHATGRPEPTKGGGTIFK